MNIHLSHKFKKPVQALKMNRKGFSSIVGALFMVLIVVSLASAYFFYTLSQNTNYNAAVRQQNQYDLIRMSESVQAVDTQYNVLFDGSVAVTTTIKNYGPSSVNLTTIWVKTINGAFINANFTSINVTVQGGAVISRVFSVRILGIPMNGNTLSSWLVTSRGNTIALEPKTSQDVIVAQVSQGIGSVAMDFSKFNHYEFASAPSGYLSNYAPTQSNYTIHQNSFIIFHVVLTNLDPNGRIGDKIRLDGNSSIYILGGGSSGQGSSVKWGYWKLLNVTNGVIFTNSPASLELSWGQATDAYFYGVGGQASPASGIYAPSAYPLNIMVLGTKNGNDFGQNIPFVSMFLLTGSV